MEERFSPLHGLGSPTLPRLSSFSDDDYDRLHSFRSENQPPDVSDVWKDIISNLTTGDIGYDYFYSTALPTGIARLTEEEDEKRMSVTGELVVSFLEAIFDHKDNPRIVEVISACFSSLAAEGIINGPYFEEFIWPQILKRVDEESSPESDFAIVTLVGNFAPFVGHSVAERLLVPLYIRYGVPSSSVNVRWKCACFIGDFCNAVKSEKVKLVLLQQFAQLCKDKNWPVRSTCTHTFTPVSIAYAAPVRKAYLAPLFVSLLEDPVEYVQFLAYRSLGLFISTFSDPPTTSITYNKRREMILFHSSQFEYNVTENLYECHFKYTAFAAKIKKNACCSSPTPQKNLSPQELMSYIINESEKMSNSYFLEYWKPPLPPVDLTFFKPRTMGLEESFQALTLQVAEDPFPPDLFQKYEESDKKRVPQVLVDHFLSMANTSNAGLRTFCAKMLPAVVLTLKDENWESVREAYKVLTCHGDIPPVTFSKEISKSCDSISCNLEYGTDEEHFEFAKKIARSSIHELAIILGEDVTNRDLFPLFNNFFMIEYADKYEQIPQFLKFLNPVVRSYFLPRLATSLNEEDLECCRDWVNDSRLKGLKWRKKLMKARMIRQIIGLFSPQETWEHLKPCILNLLLDKVANVRKAALIVATELVSHVSIDVGLLRSLLAELAQTLAYCTRWNRRQTFIYLCSRLISERVLSKEIFIAEVLPHLLELAWDVVPNVRLSLADLIVNDIIGPNNYIDPGSSKYKVLLSVLKRYQVDKDRDVRCSANQFFPPSPQTSHTPDSANMDGETSLCDHFGITQVVESVASEEIAPTM